MVRHYLAIEPVSWPRSISPPPAFISLLGQTRGSIRLWRNGSTSLSYTSGRVQVVARIFGSEWGNICDDSSFGLIEATVICHQLGYTGASSYSRTRDDT